MYLFHSVGGSLAPEEKQRGLDIASSSVLITATRTDDTSILESVMAAFSQTQIPALPATLGYLKASFAIDTGAAVNVLSADAYEALRRASRGSRWPRRPSDLNLIGVSSDSRVLSIYPFVLANTFLLYV